MMRIVSTCLLTLGLLTGCAHQQPVADRTDAAESDASLAAKRTTGSIASLSAEEIARYPEAQLVDLIVSRVSGVYATRTARGGVQLRIRGVGSIYGSNEPLYIVDGVPQPPGLGTGLPHINVQDIESIEVLKDTGSTAIYGIRGGSGVIRITTKHGR